MLKRRIVKNYKKFGIEPSPELLEFVTKCDRYSEDLITTDELQHSIGVYLDKSSLRLQALSLSIDRYKEPPMADILTESMNMVLDAIIRNPLFHGCDLKVSSEKNYILKGGKYIKPDVGIWRKNSLVFALECKTNLGYDRSSWKSHFENRTAQYVNSGLKPSGVVWIVATETNWSGFPSNDQRSGTNWLCLCQRGSWFGGKNNSTPLAKAMVPGVVESLVNSLISVI
jgi:hypothetical protein